jgi:hypothetical protein
LELPQKRYRLLQKSHRLLHFVQRPTYEIALLGFVVGFSGLREPANVN